MSLSLGELLYLHCYQDIDIDPMIFRDKDTREFLIALQKMPIESVRGLDRWGEVSPIPISKEAGMDAINNDIFTPLVNERMEFLRHKLLTHDWSSLAEAFPEIDNKHFKSYNIKNPMDLVLEDIDYFPFFPEWDGENGNAMRGLRDDDLIVIFAMSKMGKSTICAYLAYKAIEQGLPIGFYPTELTIPVTLKYILGYEYGLRGNESLMFFSQNPDKFKELIEKYNHLIFVPPTNIFNWSDYTALYESPAKVIFHDNFVRSLAHLGMNEDAASANQLSRKVSTLQQKYQKATFIVTQEATDKASPKQLEANPDIKEIGAGHTAIGRGLQQECSLLLNIQNRANNSIGKKIVISHDRFRGVSDIDSQISLEITKRGTLHVEVLHDNMTAQIKKAERLLQL